MEKTFIPSFSDTFRKYKRHLKYHNGLQSLSALEVFIVLYTPSTKVRTAQFRQHLSDMIEEVKKAEGK